MTAVAAESMPPTPPPVAETFVRVLVGFGVVWAAIWRLPAMVEVVEVSIVGLKMARKEALSQKKRNSAPMPFRTTTEESVVLGLRSRLDWILKALDLGFPTPFSL